MTAGSDSFPKHLNFSQRYGYEPLPEPMRLEVISDDLRRELCNVIRKYFIDMATYESFFDHDKRLIERILGRSMKRPESAISTNYHDVIGTFERILTTLEFNKVLDLLEITLEELEESDGLSEQIGALFDEHAAPYWLDMSQWPYRFAPRSSHEQGDAIQHAIEMIHKGGMDGAKTHLRDAVEHINTGQYAASVADSIHAVESVARIIDPKANKTLGPALKSLENAGVLNHPALRGAFDKLYGYTNTEQGIRHALHDKDAPDVGLDEAMFMFGACASFAAYLTEKHRQADST